MHNSNSKKWIDAMKDEMKFMQDNDVWHLVELPEGVKPIWFTWIFKGQMTYILFFLVHFGLLFF